jgi:hypothetical protein
MQNKAAMFESTAVRDTRAIAWVKRASAIVVSVYLVIGMIALYRALVQVPSLEMQSPDVLQNGAAVTSTVVSYARVPLDVRIELVQDAHTEIVAAQRVPKNEWSLLDPRTRKSSQTAVLTDDLLSRFAEGKAIVRTTVIRREQLTRLPPPVIREQVVEIKR